MSTIFYNKEGEILVNGHPIIMRHTDDDEGCDECVFYDKEYELCELDNMLDNCQMHGYHLPCHDNLLAIYADSRVSTKNPTRKIKHR